MEKGLRNIGSCFQNTFERSRRRGQSASDSRGPCFNFFSCVERARTDIHTRTTTARARLCAWPLAQENAITGRWAWERRGQVAPCRFHAIGPTAVRRT